MPDAPKKFYLTTPIYYVNARPHIGHAYTTIVADVLARRHRLLGDDTWFLTGTDEHGQKIERSAAAAGVPPQAFADEVSAQFKALWDRMGITYDDYIRTTEPRHAAGVQKLFTTLYDNGFIYLDSYTGAYCVSDEAFVDVPVGAPCPDCGRITEQVTEENFFFKLSAFQDKLLALIESNTLKIENEARRNEVLSFVRGGLKDLSVSRSSFTWGIPVPEDVQRRAGATQKHIVYVWLDALANYMTAVGYGDDSAAAQARFEKYWPADLHLVGKEIIRFHCVYWPAFLMAAQLPLPKAITAHGWLLFDNAKMSKSKGNIVRTETILDAFGTLYPNLVIPSEAHSAQTRNPEEANATPIADTLQPPTHQPAKAECDLFAADVLRYFLLREIPFGQDGTFSFEALVTRYNADLANGYGNLVSRTLKMIETFCSGIVPDSPRSALVRWASVDIYAKPVANLFEDLEFADALSECSKYIRSVDQHLSEEAPWKLAKNESLASRALINAVLYGSAESIRIITALLYPILPYATARVWAQLGLGDIEQAARDGELTNLQWGGLKPGTKLGALAPIFPRADKGLIDIMNDMENSQSATAPAAASEPSTTAPAPAASTEADVPQIGIDDFAKVELRIAQVLVAERIPKADKLLRLEVDLGRNAAGEPEKRQILSGIAEHYAPEDLIGKRIIVITNLAPRKMRGLESHGMLLAASEEGGKPYLATVPEGVPVGTRLK